MSAAAFTPMTVHVPDPRTGATRAHDIRPAAPAPDTSRALKVALLANGKRNSVELLQLLVEELGHLVAIGEVRSFRKDSVSVPPSDADRAEIESFADVVLVALGDCGSCSSRSVRDAIEMEWAGIPSVVVVADALVVMAEAMLRLSEMEGYRYLVTPYPVGSASAEELRLRAKHLAPEALDLLMTGRPHVRTALEPRARRQVGLPVTVRFASEDEAIEAAFEQGWTDGLPVVLPTPERVAAMLAGADRDPSEVLFTMETRDGLAVNVGAVAVNAVMAGCRPEFFPAVLAAVDALGDPACNLHAHSATMSGAQQVVLFNGPVRHELAMNLGQGAMGPGNRATSTIGRAVRLVIRNVCRSLHGELDRASYGHPGRYSWCFAEAEETSPWPSFAQRRGFSVDDSTVSIYATMWQVMVQPDTRDAEEYLDLTCSLTRQFAQMNQLVPSGVAATAFNEHRTLLFVLGREHAEVLVDGGYGDIERLQAAMFDRLTGPHPEWEPVGVAHPANIAPFHLNATGHLQTTVMGPFASHNVVTRRIPRVTPSERGQIEGM